MIINNVTDVVILSVAKDLQVSEAVECCTAREILEFLYPAHGLIVAFTPFRMTVSTCSRHRLCLLLLLARAADVALIRQINFLSEGVRLGLSQKKIPRDSTMTYSPWGLTFSDGPRMAPYHKKLREINVEHHHDYKSYRKSDSTDVGVLSARGLGDKLFNNNIEHGTRRESKEVRQEG